MEGFRPAVFGPFGFSKILLKKIAGIHSGLIFRVLKNHTRPDGWALQNYNSLIINVL